MNRNSSFQSSLKSRLKVCSATVFLYIVYSFCGYEQ
jgi:hypothetical protein